MSTVITSTSTGQSKFHNAKPSFIGLLRAEIFKVFRQRIVWVLLLLLLGAIALPHIISVTAQTTKDHLHNTPLSFFYDEMEIILSILRVFIGIFLVIVTSLVIGLEYQLGTIRILLSRGVGRLQLLAAKMMAVVIIGLALLVIGLVISAIMLMLVVLILTGNLNAFNALTADFWSNTWLYLLTVLISMGVTILMATAMNVLGRSLSFGLSASLGWFPVDNVGVYIIVLLAYRVTHAQFWQNITAYMLGLNLNAMPAVLLPAKLQATSIGVVPAVAVDSAHTLWVTLVYGVIFAVVAVVFTWKRDVKE